MQWYITSQPGYSWISSSHPARSGQLPQCRSKDHRTPTDSELFCVDCYKGEYDAISIKLFHTNNVEQMNSGPQL